jgi:phage terminase small subunit
VNLKLQGLSDREALLKAGFPVWNAEHATSIITEEMRAEIAAKTKELVERTLEVGLIDAQEILEQLTDELRGDVADLYDEEGNLKPVHDWPMWARQGGIEFIDEPNMVHSADEGGASWDQMGRRIKILGRNRAKTRELAMKHKGVNAMVEAKQGDVNITIVTADQARRVVDAKKRLLKATVKEIKE